MCTSSEISVTTKSIITARPSIWVPTLKLMPPFDHHVTLWMTGATTAWCSSLAERKPLPNALSMPRLCSSAASLTRCIHCTAVMHDSTKDEPTAKIPISEPCRGMRLPKKRISANETAGMSGMSQA